MTFGNPPSSECAVEGGEGDAGTTTLPVLDCDRELPWLGDRVVRCPSRVHVSDMCTPWGIASGASTMEAPKSNLLLSMFPWGAVGLAVWVSSSLL